ncbi:MAG: hypothetical protein RBT49_11410 [Bacteroidales bacterium]|jgi:hypothetical protein|nr:hypothetical protein [Bacteroidales bacterium]
MKNTILNIEKSTLIILSLFIIYINCTSFSTIPDLSSPTQEVPREYLLTENLDLICTPIQKEQISNYISISYSLLYKKHLADFSFQAKLSEFLNETTITELISTSKIILPSIDSVVLIFPYHYFW